MTSSIALTEDDRTTFVRDGVLIRRRLLHGDHLGRAAALIDDWYRNRYRAEDLTAYTNRTFAPELDRHPDLLALFHDGGLADLAEQLLGPALTAPVITAQVQIRLPDAAPQPAKAMHVDGVACPHLDAAELRTFTLIAGVMLCGLPAAEAGALHYLPGGHWRMARHFATNWRVGDGEQTPPDVAAQPGTPLLAEPGDAIVMHHLVPHRVAANTSPVPRTMVYFRVHHHDHDRLALRALRDPWLEYPGLRDLAQHHAPAGPRPL
ncbi:phytanoyl-CoA dioxygenase family protein [Streptomyces ehimensis]|uniref:Phytanoyl-CoA dioxygenase family protein n=1 Tax=Streptomyces ehimensis TaxID=68195 RepID=A0ABV9BDT8_9ACTN